MNIPILIEQTILLNSEFPEPKQAFAFTFTIPAFKNIYKDGKKIGQYKSLSKDNQIKYLREAMLKYLPHIDNFYFEQHPNNSFTHIHSHGFVDNLSLSEAKDLQRLIAEEFGFKSQKQIDDCCFYKPITDINGWRKYILKDQTSTDTLYTFGKNKK